MHHIIVSLVLASVLEINAAPTDVEASGSAHISGSVPKIFSVDNGNVGVDFLGFKASAGLGGLLSGDAAAGGLHAEAGTPFGQAARAGLGGQVGGEGKSVGGLYADATAGGNVAAGAGLAGGAGGEGAAGFSYAGASGGGGVYKETIKTRFKPATVVEKHIELGAVVPAHTEKEVEVVHEAKPQKTYIERTVIPQYEEKTIYVPSYVEKTIKVPTVVEKRVKVEVEPKVVEKHIETAPAGVNFDTSVVKEEVVPVSVYHKTKFRTRPRHHFRKHFYFGGYGGGYGSGYGGGYGGGYGSASAEAAGAGNVGGTSSFTVRKTVNPQLFNDIFNIPISTLGAVSKLVSGIAGGTSGSISVSKSVSAGAY